MIALTHQLSQRIFRERRRPRLPNLATSSGFGDNITYIVGSAATQIGLSISVDPSPRPSPTLADVPCRTCDASLQLGRRLGPFILISRLGQGAQGDVWKAARQGLDGEIVALKILNPSLAKHQRRLAQFRREAERGARMAGPSLLQVFESGEVDGYLYMAMPFVEGVSLHEVIRSRRAYLSGDDVAQPHPLITAADDDYLAGMTRLMAHAARALEVVHTNRVVHRDIKPANILLDCNRPLAVYLCDLGLGRDLEVATIEQMRDGAGTPMYMSPERLLRAPADEIRSDVYSMGVTLFEALTLGRPFEDPEGVPISALSAFLAHAHPRPPRAVDPHIPQPLEAIILKAMARNPADRYRSAAELAAELDRWDAPANDERRRDFLPHPHLSMNTADAAELRNAPANRL
ncbi:serine/threonine-protein kinase [Paludisphaera borealis]|uniref:Serine/threonine-protein kinase PrkC n=1 Tax=Paludisphaera borealis TaxID=1387353 RepID=A0A1U7CKV5_9BACT|nr:serine/threonine-protein kinase [Paludisphaera borealis]APW59574.1 Serine/threonine-protein kinase PrkC [Paludisphaera borealis]